MYPPFELIIRLASLISAQSKGHVVVAHVQYYRMFKRRNAVNIVEHTHNMILSYQRAGLFAALGLIRSKSKLSLSKIKRQNSYFVMMRFLDVYNGFGGFEKDYWLWDGIQSSLMISSSVMYVF